MLFKFLWVTKRVLKIRWNDSDNFPHFSIRKKLFDSLIRTAPTLNVGHNYLDIYFPNSTLSTALHGPVFTGYMPRSACS